MDESGKVKPSSGSTGPTIATNGGEAVHQEDDPYLLQPITPPPWSSSFRSKRHSMPSASSSASSASSSDSSCLRRSCCPRHHHLHHPQHDLHRPSSRWRATPHNQLRTSADVEAIIIAQADPEGLSDEVPAPLALEGGHHRHDRHHCRRCCHADEEEEQEEEEEGAAPPCATLSLLALAPSPFHRHLEATAPPSLYPPSSPYNAPTPSSSSSSSHRTASRPSHHHRHPLLNLSSSSSSSSSSFSAPPVLPQLQLQQRQRQRQQQLFASFRFADGSGRVGDIIVEDDVWPWAAGESVEEVFAAEEDFDVAVLDDRGKRVRRPLLPLVLRDGWQLVVAHRITAAVLVYTLVPHSPYGIGRDPAVCFGEEVLLRILSFLDVRSLHVVSLVSQTWKRISEDNSLWRAKSLDAKPFLKEYLLKVFEESQAPWRTIYRTLKYPHRWSEEHKAKGIFVVEKGRTAVVMGVTPTNLSIQNNRPINAGAELFWYFETIVNSKENQWNIGFGITDSRWDKEIKFVGYDRESYNYGYTSNGKMRATAKYDGFPNYGQDDRLGFWLEYNSPRMDITLHVFLNDTLIHSWKNVYEKHQPPLYFTTTLYQDGTQVSFTS